MNRKAFRAALPDGQETALLAFVDRFADAEGRLDINATLERGMASTSADEVAAIISALSLFPHDHSMVPLIQRGLEWSHADPWDSVRVASLSAVVRTMTDFDPVRERLKQLCFDSNPAVRNMAVDILDAETETEEDRQLEMWRRFNEKHPGTFRSSLIGRKYTNTSFGAREEDFK